MGNRLFVFACNRLGVAYIASIMAATCIKQHRLLLLPTLLFSSLALVPFYVLLRCRNRIFVRFYRRCGWISLCLLDIAVVGFGGVEGRAIVSHHGYRGHVNPLADLNDMAKYSQNTG